MNEEIVKSEKQRLPLTHSALLKVLAFILAIVCLAAGILGVLGAVLMVNYDVYRSDKDDFYEDLVRDSAYSDAHDMGYYVGTQRFEEADELLAVKNIAAAEVVCSGAESRRWTGGDWSGSEDSLVVEYDWTYTLTEEGSLIPGYNGRKDNQMTVRLRIADEPSLYDEYRLAYMATELAYTMMYSVYFVIVLAAAAFILCVVFLLNAAGRRRGKPGVTPAWTTAVPLDLLCAAIFGLAALSIVCINALWWYVDDVFAVLLSALILVADAAMALAFLMSCALRLKLGKWWQNTLIFRLLRLIWRGLRVLLRYFGNITLFWQAGLIFAGVAAVELILIVATGHAPEVEFIFWLMGKIVLLAGMIYLCLMLRELGRCGRAVARGDMSFRPDTRFMPRVFREHAENMQSMSHAVNKAVEQRMVSERMKTELITNVSHDLKTPLTSLINYSDLICRADCDNPHHREYAAVLHRQSERMKRLIDDLVEASKASTGNLDVDLAPCEAGVMLMQVAGEYEQRLNELGLDLVASQPVHPITIMADGRRLWRVMDNLMNNICKYALSGTRVYLSLEDVGGRAVLSFKNTSREMLNLSPEELMERFVRGDSSRQSEGSGLGLSIARSLTELQGGKMEIVCDGDLFKVVLSFPAVKNDK